MLGRMTTYMALLRGVNVGKAKRVPMAEFRRLLPRWVHGRGDLLNSGNAVFRARSGNAGTCTPPNRRGDRAKIEGRSTGDRQVREATWPRS